MSSLAAPLPDPPSTAPGESDPRPLHPVGPAGVPAAGGVPAPCRRCGHAHEAHQHYRAGTDCALCPPGDCPKYRRRSRFRLSGRWLPGR
jgi:hypothetical protein